jgi:hypothetical protein
VKKANTIKRALKSPVTIGDRIITEIHFDLLHIQYGWDKENKDYNKGSPRNNYTEPDVIAFFEQLSILAQTPTEQVVSLKVVDKRYVFYVFDGPKKLKMVVDFMKNSSTFVVTIH